MKSALIIYYSQTGQLKQIVQSITGPLSDEFNLVYEELKPIPPYPFPWKGMEFFQAFPESVQEIPCRLVPFNFDPDAEYALVILAYQVWYLSPSIPFTSFLQSPEAKKVLAGKPVITVLGVRNMWVMAQERIKQHIDEAGGKLLGNIVLVDPAPNLVSVITIVRWLMKGEQIPGGRVGKLLPRAGVPEEEIRGAFRFGVIINDAIRNNDLEGLQEKLLEKGAIKINPVLMNIEKTGKRMFGMWSKFILKRGVYGESAREGRLKLFKYYLFAVIYLISPIVAALMRISTSIARKRTRKWIDYYSGRTSESSVR